jgi:curved DNA-binding protein CbpA
MSAPSAVGTLADTPFAHALIYARNRRLSGRLELTAPDERRAAVSLWRGRIMFVEIAPASACAGAFLGAILYELGFIDSATLDATLMEIAKTKRRHGEVLIERKAITPAQRDEGLVEQVHRKVHHLFTFPPETRYAFYDARVPSGEPPIAVDPVGPVWRGVRDYPPTKFVTETMRRIGDNALRTTAGGSARLPPAETALTEALASRPMTLAEMKKVTDLPAARVELLVYLLVIAKCVEAVSGARTHPSTGQLPTSMPSGPMHAVRNPSSGSIPVQSLRSDSGVIRSAPQRISVSTPSRPLTPLGIQVQPVPRLGTPTGIPAQRPPMPPPQRSITPSGIPAQRISLTPPGMPATSSPSSSKFPAQRPISMTPPGGAVAAPIQSPAELGAEGVMLRATAVDTEDYFQVLGVAESATIEAVRAAYMRLAKVWHPDRTPAELRGLQNEIGKVFSAMTRAQKTLVDPDARKSYLAGRNAKPKARPRTEVMREIVHATTRRDAVFVVQLCQELIDSDAEDAEAVARQAWASVYFGEASDDELRIALTKLDKAVNLNRTDDQAVYHRGMAHKRLNNVPAAFRDFSRALQLNPKNVDAEREVRIFAMRARKGSGEHKMVLPFLDKIGKK